MLSFFSLARSHSPEQRRSRTTNKTPNFGGHDLAGGGVVYYRRRETRGAFLKPNMGTRWPDLPLLLAVACFNQIETYLSGREGSQLERDVALGLGKVRKPHGLVLYIKHKPPL